MRGSQRIILIFAWLILNAAAGSAEEVFVYPPDLERDPFEPMINQEGTLNVRLIRQVGDLQLNGIIYDQKQGKSIAIINNTLLKVDDYIGSYRIETINPKEVILIKKDKKVVLKMEDGNED